MTLLSAVSRCAIQANGNIGRQTVEMGGDEGINRHGYKSIAFC